MLRNSITAPPAVIQLDRVIAVVRTVYDYWWSHDFYFPSDD